MKKIFTLLVSVFVVTMAMGQPTADINKATVAPVIDGNVDDVWEEAEENAINVAFGSETPTVGESWWKMLWDDNGLYLLVFVDDDVYMPAYKGITPANTWMYDKLEVYFDCNYKKDDGVGAQGGGEGEAGGKGHYQFAPSPEEATENGGTATTHERGHSWAFNATDRPSYYVEYFFPYSLLNDQDGNPVDKTEPIGFDVNIMDNDVVEEIRNRMNWASGGVSGENWANMDDAGLITLLGAQPGVEIESLSISGETEITTDNGTVQLTAEVVPAEATQPYKWVLTNETGMATISKEGMVTASRNGTVKVTAYSVDDFVHSNEMTITISNQKISLDEISIIKNGNFNEGADKMESWGFTKKEVFSVEADGDEDWLAINCTPQTNRWDINVNQGVNVSLDKTIKYIVRFKAYASTEMSVPLVIEDSYNETYNKDGVSSSPYGATSDWAIPVTTEPKWFELDVTFANRIDESTYSFGFQPGALNGTLFLDSIYMFKESDLALVDPTAGLETVDGSSLSVYPNPVNNTLYVDLSDINAKVAIYNSVGQKLMEKTATRNRVQFDVSNLRKGMYFVRLEDGTTQKFIK